MNRTLFFGIVLIISFSNCTQAGTKSNETKTQTPAPVVQTETAYLPSIPLSELEYMWPICNQIDYIFYTLPISTSVNDAPSAQAHLKHISSTPVPASMKNNCKNGIGRIFYKADGEDLLEAELFFGPNCTFFVFHKNGKPAYSNIMTPDGINHFNQIISAVTNATNQQ